MTDCTPWYSAPLARRAPVGGIHDPLDGRDYKGGELLPFYVPRPLMPQIDESLYPALIQHLVRQGLEVSRLMVDPAALRAHQRIDRLHMEQMPREVLDKPILISGDDYVLDGNHRWWAHVKLGIDPVAAIRIGANFEPAIAALFEFPGTYTLARHEETN